MFWGTSPLGDPRGNPGPGPYCPEPKGNLPGTCRRGGEEGGGGRKKKKEKKEKKKKERGEEHYSSAAGLAGVSLLPRAATVVFGEPPAGQGTCPGRGRIRSFGSFLGHGGYTLAAICLTGLGRNTRAMRTLALGHELEHALEHARSFSMIFNSGFNSR